MRHVFDIERTVRTYRLYFPRHEHTLRDLLHSVARSLDRLLPPEVSKAIDQEGSTLDKSPEGKLIVRRHPRLDAALQDLIDLGMFRTFTPEEFGGFELPLAIYYLTVQLISYYDTSLALVFLVHGNAMYAIDRYGSPEQRACYLPDLIAGEKLATVAFTEPLAGSDAGSIRTRAIREGDSYVLNGSKLFITNGGDADLLVTTARTGPLEQGIDGVSAFIVEREADGVEILGLENKTGLSGSPTAALDFTDVRIPADRLLGPQNKGGHVMFAGVGMTRVNIGAQALGIAKRAFDAAVDFALQREQGGSAIIQHDAIQQRICDMALIISAMENLICHDSSLEDRGEWHVREMSITKYYCSESLQELTLRAINVHGGYGVSRDYVVERCRREAVALPLYGGTSEIQWFIIARELLDCVARTAHVDYRTRDEQLAGQLAQRCGQFQGVLAQRIREVQKRLWQAVEQVSGYADPTPHYRHLTELATALSTAQVLLWQASAREAADLERELALVAVDRLEDLAVSACERVASGIDRSRLKQAILSRVE